VPTGAPQAKGQVERGNSIVTPMLGKLSESIEQAGWLLSY